MTDQKPAIQKKALVAVQNVDRPRLRLINDEECVKGIQKANDDASKGKYKIVSYGMPYYENWDFQSFYEKYLMEKYGIQYEEGGCVIRTEGECYSMVMQNIIEEKFGKDIFQKAREEAKIKYEKDNISNSQ